MPALYKPRTMVFSIPTIDTQSVSAKNLWLEKDGIKMDVNISTDDSKIYFLPKSPYVEYSNYRIIFGRGIKHTNGKPIHKQYVLPYIIKNRSLVFKAGTHGSIQHLNEEPVFSRINYPYVERHIIMPKTATVENKIGRNKPGGNKLYGYVPVGYKPGRYKPSNDTLSEDRLREDRFNEYKLNEYNINEDTDNEDTFIEDTFNEEYIEDGTTKGHKKKWLIPLIALFSIVFLILFYVILTSTRTVDISGTRIAENTFLSGESTLTNPGNILSASDPIVKGRDITINYTGNAKTTRLHIWDYAAEDGDSVQVFVDGDAVTNRNTIYNKPFKVKVPTNGVVEVRGIRDGGGGITYAVYCELNKTTYLNDAPIGGSNKYTFVKK